LRLGTRGKLESSRSALASKGFVVTAPVDQAPPARPVTAPRRWKMWLLTCLAIYPVITGLGYLLQAVAGGLPVYAHFLILVPIAVALLVFVVMPALTRRFHRWITR
jgi:antibiotic biosynthesis monooxygenase (ABM) superfamily enzyme